MIHLLDVNVLIALCDPAHQGTSFGPMTSRSRRPATGPTFRARMI